MVTHSIWSPWRQSSPAQCRYQPRPKAVGCMPKLGVQIVVVSPFWWKMYEQRFRRRQLAQSLDDLVSPHEYRLRDRQAERRGGLKVDDQLEACGLLHRQL